MASTVKENIPRNGAVLRIDSVACEVSNHKPLGLAHVKSTASAYSETRQGLYFAVG